jgi:hypothetical protein
MDDLAGFLRTRRSRIDPALDALARVLALDTVGQLRLAAGKCPDDPQLTALIGELAMHSDRFRRLWARADVHCGTHGRKPYAYPLVGRLDLHQENFMVADDAGTELVILSAAPGSRAYDGLRLLASIGATDDREQAGPDPEPGGTNLGRPGSRPAGA